jgi:hypothetical protein
MLALSEIIYGSCELELALHEVTAPVSLVMNRDDRTRAIQKEKGPAKQPSLKANLRAKIAVDSGSRSSRSR